MAFKSFAEFFNRYIAEPVQYDAGYNAVNTAMIALLFAAGVWILWEFIFKKEKIVISRDFLFGLLGWLLFGASLRVLQDTGYFQSVLFVTPLIYVWVGALTIVSLLVAQRLERRFRIHAIIFWSGFGYGMATLNIVKLPFVGYKGFTIICLLMAFWAGMLWMLNKRFAFFSFENSATIWAHLLDGSASFTGITFFQFWEKHVIGRGLIEFFETNQVFLINGSAAWAIILMKLSVIPLVLYFIDKYGESSKEKLFYKTVIFALGIVIGTRNTLQVLALGG